MYKWLIIALLIVIAIGVWSLGSETASHQALAKNTFEESPVGWAVLTGVVGYIIVVQVKKSWTWMTEKIRAYSTAKKA